MVVVMKAGVSEGQIQHVVSKLIEMNFDIHRSTGVQKTILGAIGDHINFDPREIEALDGVQEVVRITAPYKLASRGFKQEDTVIEVNGVKIGGEEVVVMAGSCSVESEEGINIIAEKVRQAGAKILRGGVYQPESSPYSFQGIDKQSLRFLREAADRRGLLVTAEITDVGKIPIVTEYADILQVGARNMRNYDLLHELAKVRKPVLLKRGMSATLEETLMSAEYVMAGGNYEVILCERGIRTFETGTRNMMDISAIPIFQKLSHLPVIADPSQGAGLRDAVAPLARAAVAAGANGLMLEVHGDSENAKSGSPQSLCIEQFEKLMRECASIARVVGRRMNGGR